MIDNEEDHEQSEYYSIGACLNENIDISKAEDKQYHRQY